MWSSTTSSTEIVEEKGIKLVGIGILKISTELHINAINNLIWPMDGNIINLVHCA